MILLDSTVLVDVLRDRTGRARTALEARVGAEAIVFTRITQFEIMRGCRDQRQWERLARHFAGHAMLEAGERCWEDAARIVMDLRKKGRSVRSGVDCIIAQIAIDHDRLLLHKDRDFETIAAIRPLRQEWIDVRDQKR